MHVSTLVASGIVHPDIEDQTVLIKPNPAADVVVTLPPSHGVTKGHRVRVQIAAVSQTNGHQVKPGNATDTIAMHGITPAAGKFVQCTHASEALGDGIDLVADGAGNWLGFPTGTWTRQA